MMKTRISFRLGLLAGLLASIGGTAQAADPDIGKPQPQIASIVKEISAKRIEATVRKLVSFGTRHTMSDTVSETRGIGAARRWIKAELEQCSAASGGRLKVAFDSYLQGATPRLSRPTEIVNVVATLPGTQAQSTDRIYVVSGHYDSRNSTDSDSVGDSPGANDDASGTAAVMEMACIMSKYQFDATLVFMAVAGEEQGLYGATHWAEQAIQNKLNIGGMFTNDIIGSSRSDDGRIDDTQVRVFAEGIPALKEVPDNVRALIETGGENDSPTRQLARHVKEVGERYVDKFTVNVIQRRDRYLRGGDHIPFLVRGYAALRFTEPNENFNHQHQDVRLENNVQMGDLTDFVDFNYVSKVAKVNAAALASVATAPASPKKVEMKVTKLENDTNLAWSANNEPDLAGYRVVWRTTDASSWQGAAYVGNATNYTARGLSKDNYFFGVQAVDKDGNVSVATYPMPMR